MIDKSVAQEMFKTANMLKRHIDNQISKNISKDLTVPQGYLIAFVQEASKEKDIFQKDIEEEFQLQRSSVSLMLGNMEKNGLIQRVSDNQDKRLKKIILTEKAIQYEKEINAIMSKEREYILANISAKEQKTIIEVFEKIQHNLK